MQVPPRAFIQLDVWMKTFLLVFPHFAVGLQISAALL